MKRYFQPDIPLLLSPLNRFHPHPRQFLTENETAEPRIGGIGGDTIDTSNRTIIKYNRNAVIFHDDSII